MRRVLVVTVAVIALLFTLCGVAYAATPQDIYNDYLAHSKLTSNYSVADLQAYLGYAPVQQYGDPGIVDSLNTLVKSILAQQQAPRNNFPFTGFELFLGLGVALVLVSGGLSLRWVSQRR